MNDSSAMENDSESSIVVVAARIQERAREVASELTAVELAKAELDQLRAMLEEEKKQTNAVRRTMLSTVRTRHDVELELSQIQSQQEEFVANLEQNDYETQQAKKEMKHVHDEWENTVKNVYVEHDLQRELYKRSVQSRIQQRQDLVKQRDDHLRQVQQETRAFQRETKRMVEQTHQMEQNIVEMDGRIGKDDDAMDALHRQIQAARKKVSADSMVLHAHMYLLAYFFLNTFSFSLVILEIIFAKIIERR